MAIATRTIGKPYTLARLSHTTLSLRESKELPAGEVNKNLPNRQLSAMIFNQQGSQLQQKLGTDG